MKIIILSTGQTLLNYILIEKDWNKNLFVIDISRMNINIANKIKNKILVNIENNTSNLKKIYNYYIFFIKYFFKIKKGIIIGDDNLVISIPFRKKMTILEDGLSNYKKPLPKNNFTKLKLFFVGEFKEYISFGYSENIKKIYLTGLAPIPKEIAHKVEIINLKELWDKKNLEEQNEILDIFSFDLNIKETIKSRDIILFTQPLSEDGVITEEEKIEIYSKIIKKYPQNRLIVKTHPREKTNYKEMFKDNLVLDNPFPFEILNLLDVKFNKAVTIFSTAALGLGKDVAVDFYGTEVNDKILARFGSCENIMKRNSYLEEEE